MRSGCSQCPGGTLKPGPAQHRRDPCPYFAGTKRLGDVVIGSGLERCQDIRLCSSSGQHEDVRVTEPPDPPQYLKAINIRHAHVQRDQARLPVPHHLNTRAPVRSRVDFEARLNKHPFKQIAHVRVIFYNYCHTNVTHVPPELPGLRSWPSAAQET